MISERARLVHWSYFLSDLTATTAAFVAAHVVRNVLPVTTDWFGELYPLSHYLPLLGFILPAWALIFYSCGLYGRRLSRTVHTEVSRLLRAMILCGLVFSVAIVAARLTYVSRPFILIFLLANALFVAIGRGLVRAVILDNTVRRRVLVAGGRKEVLRAAASVDAHRDWGLEVIGVIGDGTWTADAALPYAFLGVYEDIPKLVQGETVID